MRVVGFWRAFAAENAPWGGGSVLKSESLRCITTACRGMYEPLKGRAATASQPRRTHARNEILDFVTCCCWCTRESSRGDLTHILSANCPRTATKTTQIEPTNQSLCHWFCVGLLHNVGWSWGRFFLVSQNKSLLRDCRRARPRGCIRACYPAMGRPMAFLDPWTFMGSNRTQKPSCLLAEPLVSDRVAVLHKNVLRASGRSCGVFPPYRPGGS